MAGESQQAARAARDGRPKTAVTRVWQGSYGVFGARKVWLVIDRQGIPAARCAIERLMRELGLAVAAARGSAPPGPTLGVGWHTDLVRRQFSQPGRTGCGAPTSITRLLGVRDRRLLSPDPSWQAAGARTFEPLD